MQAYHQMVLKNKLAIFSQRESAQPQQGLIDLLNDQERLWRELQSSSPSLAGWFEFKNKENTSAWLKETITKQQQAIQEILPLLALNKRGGRVGYYLATAALDLLVRLASLLRSVNCAATLSLPIVGLKCLSMHCSPATIGLMLMNPISPLFVLAGLGYFSHRVLTQGNAMFNTIAMLQAVINYLTIQTLPSLEGAMQLPRSIPTIEAIPLLREELTAADQKLFDRAALLTFRRDAPCEIRDLIPELSQAIGSELDKKETMALKRVPVKNLCKVSIKPQHT